MRRWRSTAISYVTGFGGTLYRLNQANGTILSAKRSRATSAPVVVGKDVFFTRRADDGKNKKAEEALVKADRATAKDQLEAVRRTIESAQPQWTLTI